MAENALSLSRQLCFAVYSTAHAFGRVYKPLLDRLGLTYPQYLVMLALWEKDGVPVKTLGEQLLLDSGTLTPLLKRLEAAGLVRRKRDARDERQVLITLTAEGSALREKAAAAVPATIGCAVGIEGTAARALHAELTALRANLLAFAEKNGNGD